MFDTAYHLLDNIVTAAENIYDRFKLEWRDPGDPGDYIRYGLPLSR
jgi:hypothetical protein